MSRALATGMILLAAATTLLLVAGSASAATEDVAIRSFAFQPNPIEVQPGDTIRWTNEDSARHSATADTGTGSWDTGELGQSASTTVNFPNAGTFPYHCKIHPSMTGTVRVVAQAPQQNTPPSITMQSPSHLALVSGIVTVTGSVSDPDAGTTLVVTVDVDGQTRSASISSGTWSYAWDTRTVTNGQHNLTARATDGVVVAPTSKVTVTVRNPPTVAVLSPAEGANLSIDDVVTVAGDATAAPGTALLVSVSLDGGAFLPATGGTSWSFAWNTSGYTPGNHTLQAQASDGTLTVVSAVRTVTLSVRPPPPPDLLPILLVHAPAEGATVAGIVNVSGTATDPDGPLPRVEIDANGEGWRNATGRAASAWWYHWIPADLASGPVTIHVRASDGNGTALVTRHVTLNASSASLTIELNGVAPREGRSLTARVLSANGTAAGGARIVLSDANGATVAERIADASGNATLPAQAAGPYVLRAFAPGATGTLPLVVKPRYDITVEPLTMSFDALRPIHVNVTADGPVGGVAVHLTGDNLPQRSTTQVRTALDGSATLGYQVTMSGDLAVWVANNDTGIRVRLTPILVGSWSPRDPVVGDKITLSLSLNDPNATRAAGASIAVDAPGQPTQNLTTDAQGRVTMLASAVGTIRLEARYPGAPTANVRIPVAPPPPVAKLRDLTSRPGESGLLVSVFIQNAGEGNATFTIDALATSAAGTAVQQSARTRELAPQEEVEARFLLRLGGGDYDLSASVRNTTEALSIRARMPELQIPPPLVFNDSDEVDAAAAEEKGIPGAGAIGLLAAVAVAIGLRRR